MGIFEKMMDLTKGKVDNNIDERNESNDKAEIGDIIQGIITNIVYPDKSRNKKGGFGFIASQSLPYERIFFHWSALRQDTLRFPKLEKKMKVEFKLLYSEKTEEYEAGYRAVNIKVLQ